jgi:hypothetical protein
LLEDFSHLNENYLWIICLIRGTLRVGVNTVYLLLRIIFVEKCEKIMAQRSLTKQVSTGSREH